MAKTSSNASRKYWLFKTEPDCFSIDDLKKSPKQTTFWDGVRNYQARNMLRDDVTKGDLVFCYHSSADPLAIVGVMEVVKAGYPDHTAFDPKEGHYDPKSRRDDPTWFMVDVKLVEKFSRPVTREMLKACKACAKMMVLAQGSRLSIQPVTPAEWEAVMELAK
jgi:predicted RNA-binding protein with PUA-like domain